MRITLLTPLPATRPRGFRGRTAGGGTGPAALCRHCRLARVGGGRRRSEDRRADPRRRRTGRCRGGTNRGGHGVRGRWILGRGRGPCRCRRRDGRRGGGSCGRSEGG